MAPGAPRRDETPGESASSGRDALARVEQMNIEDKNPHVRRKRPDEKLVLIRAESGRSRLPSALVLDFLFIDVLLHFCLFADVFRTTARSS